MRASLLSWPAWALLSAVFAALTAIFGKIGVAEINSDFATFLRTIIVLAVLAMIVAATNAWQPLAAISGRTYLFLALSAVATGLSWLCYYRALQMGPAAGVAPLDKSSVVLVALFAVFFFGERLSVAGWVGVGMIGAGTFLVAAKI
jgi:transporter family protein